MNKEQENRVDQHNNFKLKGFNNGEPKESRNHSRKGIKIFSGERLPSKNVLLGCVSRVSVEQLREERKVWRPEETMQSASVFFKEGKINIVGAPQSGKGTILFGLSSICDIYTWGYIFVDGHFQETPFDTIIEAIHKAQTKNIPIFYDAFDYNFAGVSRNGGGVRDISIKKQKEKTQKIMRELDKVSVPVAITSHDAQWSDEFLNMDLVNEFTNELSTYPVYEIPLNLQSSASIMRFLIDSNIQFDNKINPSEANFFVNMREHAVFYNTLISIYGDKKKADLVLEARRNYPVLKELIRERRGEFIELLKNMVAFFNKLPPHILFTNDEDIKNSVARCSQMIFEAEYKRIFMSSLRRYKKFFN